MKIEPNLGDLATWHAARGKWGIVHEDGMAVEELAETITAINHMSRGRDGSAEEFIEELADAVVCSFQIVENNGFWDQFNAALSNSFGKLDAKLLADNLNEGHT